MVCSALSGSRGEVRLDSHMPNQVVESAHGKLGKQAIPLRWHVITSEYPPQAGGVSDYTYWVASGLAARGDEVCVWCPPCPGAQSKTEGVTVRRELGAITPSDLRHVGRQLDREPKRRRILVQWVPHGYGYRSMNVAFCFWLWNRAAWRGDQVEIMVHEPYLPFRQGSWRQNVAAFAHRLMTILVLRAAARVWMSIPAWEERLRPYTLGRAVPFQWLPIPSNIPVADDSGPVQAIRRRYAAGDSLLIGHFGTYGSPITLLLEPVLAGLGDPAGCAVLLMGVGSEKFRQALIRKKPGLAALIRSTGALSAEDLSCHVAACDILIQPYPDGVSTRRTSFMVGLSHGKPIVTTTGPLSEPFWMETEALALAPAGDAGEFLHALRRLQADTSERARMGRAARTLYMERFDISYTITALRRAAGAPESVACAS
jgi:glycosyltransferase involved in cell wall biosynthesis